MKRIKRYVTTDTLRTIYNALIQPHLYYCILAWGFSSSRLLTLQKKAIRIVCGVKYNSHTDNLFRNQFILKIHDIFELQCAKFYYKFSKGCLPIYFRNFFQRNDNIHQHNTRNRNSLHLFQYRNHTTKNCVRFNVPNLINNLPENVREKIFTHSLGGFSHYLKKYLISKYPSECTIVNCYICHNSG